MAVAAAVVACIASTAKLICDPRIQSSNSDMLRIVAIVTPEMGLFDDPTRPAIYPATDEKRNPASRAKTRPSTSVPQYNPAVMPSASWSTMSRKLTKIGTDMARAPHRTM